MYGISNDISHPLAERFVEFIDDPEFPCVGAKAALNRGGLRVVVARDFGSGWDDLRIMPALLDLAQSYRADPVPFQSLIVIFETGAPSGEAQFERILWDRLQSLSDKDQWLGQPADPRVAHDPDDPHFAMSFGGEAFFVVGLHPRSSRPARRFERPAMVFNLHDQFERLRAAGRYDKLRGTILDRDLRLAGSINPMLSQHGTLSAARSHAASWRALPENGQAQSAPTARPLYWRAEELVPCGASIGLGEPAS